MEYLIGEFSLLARISVKTLRFYHEEGVLLPSRIDPVTGYRWYDDSAAVRALAVTGLRELGFSLGAIKEIFALCEEDEDIVPFLERRRAEIASKIEEFRASERLIDEFLRRQEEIATMNLGRDIVVKELPELLIASIRFKGRYGQVGECIGRLMRRAARRAVAGPFALYHDEEYREDGADIEVCVPVAKEVSEGEVGTRLLRGGRAVTLVHRGPYDALSESYRRIAEHLKDCGLATRLPSREVYLRGPGTIFSGNPRNYLTELQAIVGKA